MSGTDRRYGLIGNTAIKTPCRACAGTNITLSGEQTIDGIAVVTDDRVLVTAQTSSVNNGIYVADTGAWVRATDMDGTYDIVTGTLVKVNSGTSYAGFWYVTTTGTPVIGTDAVDFGKASSELAVVSAFMQTVLDDANAGAARTTLGLAIGTDVQAYDATNTLAANTQTLTNKRVTARVGSTTSHATPTINTDNVDIYKLTAQAEDITSMTTNLSGTPTDGQVLIIQITGTAARAITWGASFEASTVALPTTTVTTAMLSVGFLWNSVTSKWRCMASV